MADKYLLSPIDDWDSATKPATKGAWVTNKVYHLGYIDSFRIKAASATNSGYIFLYKQNDDESITYIRQYNVPAMSSGDIIDIPIHEIIDYSFLLGTNIIGAAYATGTKYSCVNNSNNGTYIPNYNTKGVAIALGPIYNAKEFICDTLYKSYNLVNGEALRQSRTLINDSYISKNNIISILDLIPNYIYKIHDITTDIGLPPLLPTQSKWLGSLSILQPDYKSNTGWRILDWVSRDSIIPSFWRAYCYQNQTIDSLVWRRMDSTGVGIGTDGIIDIGIKSNNIVLLGDSIVAGQWSSDYKENGEIVQNSYKPTYARNTGKMSWAAQFKAYMEETYQGCTVKNNAIPGITTSGLFNNIDSLLDDDYDAAIVSIGTNNRNAADKTTSITIPLMNIINKLVLNGIRPIILTNTPYADSDDFPKKSPNNAQTVASAIRSACAALNIQCYDILTAVTDYLYDHNINIATTYSESGEILTEGFIIDSMGSTKYTAMGLHPGDLGNRIIYNTVRKLLHV